MKSGLLIRSAIVLFAVGTACAPKVYEHLKWQEATVQVDGNAREWNNPLKYYDADSQLRYELSNDAQNLYLIVKASDELQQMKLMRNGLLLEIDTAGKRKFPTSLLYPLPAEPDPQSFPHGERLQQGQQRPDMTVFKRKMIEKQTSMRVKGFQQNITNGLLDLANPAGISVKVDWDNEGALIYEAVIPFRTFYREKMQGADTLRPINFRITLEALAQMQMADGPPPGGMGGPMGGAGFPEGGGPPQGGFSGHGGPPAGGFDRDGGGSTGREKTTIVLQLRPTLQH